MRTNNLASKLVASALIAVSPTLTNCHKLEEDPRLTKPQAEQLQLTLDNLTRACATLKTACPDYNCADAKELEDKVGRAQDEVRAVVTGFTNHFLTGQEPIIITHLGCSDSRREVLIVGPTREQFELWLRDM